MEALEYMHLGGGISIRLPEREGKRFGVVGKSGSGKTNSLLVLARQLIEAGWVVNIIDPMNQFRRLRDAGLPVIVAGARDSADVKLNPDNAAALAALSFDERVSMVLDVSMYASDMEVLQPFLETLWKRILSQHEDGPFVRYALLIDEAQLYIPQNGKTEISGLILDMGKRGRQLHLSMAIASQRPASVQKDFLTQSNVMIFHQLRGVDIVALKDDLAIPEKEARQIMKRFIKGEAMVVGDTDMIELGENDYVLGRVQEWNGAPAAESVSAGVRVGTIDAAMLERIRMAVAQMSEEAEPEPTTRIQTVVERVEVPIITDEQLLRLETVAQDAINKGEELLTFGREIMALIGKTQKPAPVQQASPVEPALPKLVRPEMELKPNQVGYDDPDRAKSLPAGAARILRKLADIYPLKVTKVQIANLCDFTASGGTFGNYWGVLKRYGLVKDYGDYVAITGDGFSYLLMTPRQIPPGTSELLAMWFSVLNSGERRLLEALLNMYPHPVTREELGEITGYTASGGTFGNYLGTLRRNDLVAVVEGGLVPNAETLRLGEAVAV